LAKVSKELEKVKKENAELKKGAVNAELLKKAVKLI